MSIQDSSSHVMLCTRVIEWYFHSADLYLLSLDLLNSFECPALFCHSTLNGNGCYCDALIAHDHRVRLH